MRATACSALNEGIAALYSPRLLVHPAVKVWGTDMTGTRLFLRVGLIGLMAFGAGAATAQSMREVETPAEFPPDSYEGRQYVDSRGCVYVRAGVDGNTTWVPRVNRSREAICGFTPSLADAGEARPAATSAPDEDVTEITMAPDPEPAAEPRPAPEPEPEIEVAAAPAPQPDPAPRRVARRPAPEPAEMRRAAEPPRIVKAPVRRVVVRPERMASAGPGIASYGRCADGSPVGSLRCGAGASGGTQATYVSRGNTGVQHRTVRVSRTELVEADPSEVSARATIVPRHVYNAPEPASARITVPEGYRPAWDDDRLNQRRAYQTLEGKAEMELIWTKTVPRRLVDRTSGEDVTSEYPRLFYPFTDYETQRTYLSSRESYQVRVGQQSGRVRLVEKADPVVSTRSAPEARQARAAPEPRRARKAPEATPARRAPATQSATSAGRYIQVGAFGVASNARGSVARLNNAGLPALARPMRSGGKVLQVVMAGPFASTGEARAALGKARAAGFGDAFIR